VELTGTMKSNDETSGSKVAISKDGITGHIVEEIEESIAVKVSWRAARPRRLPKPHPSWSNGSRVDTKLLHLEMAGVLLMRSTS